MKKWLLFLLISFSTAVEAQRPLTVTHYDLQLDLRNSNSKQLKGLATLSIKAQRTDTALVLDLLRMNVDSVTDALGKLNFSYNDTSLNIRLRQALSTGDSSWVRIYYQGTPFKDPSSYGGGFYFNGDFAYNVGVGFSADPHNLGRAWFPCLDNFTERASYDFYIRTTNDKKAFSNGLLIGTSNHGDGSSTWHWKLKEAIPPYLASVAVGKYTTLSDTVVGIKGKIPILINVLKADSVKASKSFANIRSIFRNYEQRFGPYLWERVGYNAVPTIGGAMEHASNIAILSQLIDGTKNYESTIAHELAHHWFGDLVTCSTAEDMWLNEGWAVFCEYLFQEDLYGPKAYQDYVNKKHSDVLQKTAVNDSGYYAVSGIPHRLTYGSTVYEKGGLVANTLRHYIGDNLFFPTIRKYLSTYAFKDASSDTLRDYLQAETGVDLQDFFAGWVYAPGFPQFSIDSVIIRPQDANYEVLLLIRQKQLGSTHIWKNNRIPVTFLQKGGFELSTTLYQSGESNWQTVILPYSPAAILIDKKNQIADATSDQYDVIKTTGLRTYATTFSKFNVKALSDSARIMIYHHWVAVDSSESIIIGDKKARPSYARYWKLDGDLPATMDAQLILTVNSAIDGDAVTNLNSILLYRPTANSPWSEASAYSKNLSKVGNDVRGTFTIEDAPKGEYVVASFMYIDAAKEQTVPRALHTYPNPVKDVLSIDLPDNSSGDLVLINSIGQVVRRLTITPDQSSFNLSCSKLSSGFYTLQWINEKQVLGSSKIIIP